MSEFIILGAGIVGVSTALELQARGHSVVLVDRTLPGRETSYGNAGIIQAEAAEPHALPRDFKTLILMGMGVTNELSWSPIAALSSVPALFQYYRASHPARFKQISEIYWQLTSQSTVDHSVWIEAAGASDLIARGGFNFVYRDPKMFENARKDAKRFGQTYGVQSRVLDGAQFCAKEPAITQKPEGAVHWQQAWTCSDPGLLTQKYADLFEKRGGEILKGDATTLRDIATGWEVDTNAGKVTASQVVVALGPWAAGFLKRFGYKIPMLLKRGYHRHYDAPSMPNLPFVDMSCGVLAAPMTKGLRVTSGVSLVKHSAPSNPRQLDRGAAALSQYMDLGERVDAPDWVGTRPFIPDMLPVVGQAPNHRSMWVNMGHGHQGFTLGPTTARLLGDAISGQGATADLLAHLAPGRFA